MKIGKVITEFLFVRKCVCCNKILYPHERENAFCYECMLKWRFEMTKSCPTCLKSAVECTCMPKELSRSGALVLRKLTFYEPEKRGKPNNRLILFLKDRKNKRVSRFVATELLPLIRFEASVLGIEDMAERMFITYVPRSRKAKALNGHDQSDIVCREISDISGIPCVPLIKRRRGGKEQKKLSSKERATNISKLLWIDAKYLSEVQGRCAVLFDDITTTGSSLAAAVKLLKGLGVDKILCFCISSAVIHKRDDKSYVNDK